MASHPISDPARLAAMLVHQAEATSRTAALDPRLYYLARRMANNDFADWGLPQTAAHPAYQWMRTLDANLAAMPAEEPDPRAGWAGLSWGPRERCRMTLEQAMLGPSRTAVYDEEQLASRPMAEAVVAAWSDALPHSAAAIRGEVYFVNDHLNDPGHTARFPPLAAAFEAAEPSSYSGMFELARARLLAGDGDGAMTLLRAASRLNPETTGFDFEAARLMWDYGYRDVADRFLTRYVGEAFRRYDHVGLLATLRDEMGRPAPQNYADAMQRAAAEVGANFVMQITYADFLLGRGEIQAARMVLERIPTAFAGDPRIQLLAMRIALAEKDHAAAVAALAATQVTYKDPADRAWAWATVAMNYFKIGELGLGEQALLKARDAQPGNFYVMQANAELDFNKDNAQAALDEFQRGQDRFGFGRVWVLGRARCLRKLGRDPAAQSLLEDAIDRTATHGDWTYYAFPLMKIYAERGDVEKGRALMQRVVNAAYRSVGTINGLLEDYAKLDPVGAADIKQRAQAIVAGPDLGPLPPA